MTNQEIIGRLEALKSQHRTGAAVLLEAAHRFIRAVESQRDVECQDIDMLIRSIGGTPENTAPADVPAPDTTEDKPAAPAARTPEQEKQLADLRAACVKKAAAGGQKAILAFLQAHKVRSVFDLDPELYPALMFICKQEA